MFKTIAEYYTDIDPIIDLEFKAITKRRALKKAMLKIKEVETLHGFSVIWLQVWYKGKKIYGNGNIKLW
jgi:hypothetical protein